MALLEVTQACPYCESSLLQVEGAIAVPHRSCVTKLAEIFKQAEPGLKFAESVAARRGEVTLKKLDDAVKAIA